LKNKVVVVDIVPDLLRLWSWMNNTADIVRFGWSWFTRWSWVNSILDIFPFMLSYWLKKNVEVAEIIASLLYFPFKRLHWLKNNVADIFLGPWFILVKSGDDNILDRTSFHFWCNWSRSRTHGRARHT
jgi:hypothetical protein